MPGLDYYGDYDPYERGNPLYSLGGMAIFGGAELLGSKFGLGGYAARQARGAEALLDRLGDFGRSYGGSPEQVLGMDKGGGPWGNKGRSKRSPIGRSARRAARDNLGLEGKANALKAKSKQNIRWAKSLKRIGRRWGIIGTATIGYELSKAMFSVGGDFRIRKQDLAEQRRKVYNDDTFMDSRAAFTQRQRAIQVIHNSQMGVRSAMGSEASYLHY